MTSAAMTGAMAWKAGRMADSALVGILLATQWWVRRVGPELWLSEEADADAEGPMSGFVAAEQVAGVQQVVLFPGPHAVTLKGRLVELWAQVAAGGVDPFEADCRAMLQRLMQQGPAMQVSHWQPQPGDFERVFRPELASHAEEAYASMWNGPMWLKRKPDQSEVAVVVSGVESLLMGNEDFPGGWRGLAPQLMPDTVWVRFRFHRPGTAMGMAYDGLTRIDERWVWFPKPYRVLGDRLRELMS